MRVVGPFNIAAEPVIGAAQLSQLLSARPVPLPAAVLRGAAAVTFALRLQPAEPGWVDMALGVPLMGTDRSQAELGWSPQDHTAPPARATSGPARVRELLTGLGKRQ